MRIKLKIPKGDEEALKKKQKVSLPNPVQISFLKETNMDYSALYTKLESNIKSNMAEDKRRVHEDCSFLTTRHQIMKSRSLDRLLSFLQQNEQKYTDFLQPVVIGNRSSAQMHNSLWFIPWIPW